MSIGTDSIWNDPFTRSDNALTLGVGYTTFQIDDAAPTVIGIASNQAVLLGGDLADDIRGAYIDPALFASADYSCDTSVSEIPAAGPIGVWLRLTFDGDGLPSGYCLGRTGPFSLITRVDAGVVLEEPLQSAYVGAFDQGDVEYFIRGSVETVAGNVVLKLYAASSENGTYTQVATFTDSSADKKIAPGTAGIGGFVYYDPEKSISWGYLKVNGTAVSTGNATARRFEAIAGAARNLIGQLFGGKGRLFNKAGPSYG